MVARSDAMGVRKDGFGDGHGVFACDIKKNNEELENITQLEVDVTNTKSIQKAYEYILKYPVKRCIK